MTKTYPLTLILEGLPCVVIGGGQIAERKIEALLDAGACVRVVSPQLTARLEERVAQGEIEVVRRAYRDGDLSGAFLVIASVDDAEVNTQVWEEAQRLQILINTVDDPPRCNFYVPAVVRRGRLSLAVSTTGASCAMTARIRRDLEKRYTDDHAALLDLFAELRPVVMERFPSAFKQRKAVWYRLVDAGLLELIVAEGVEAARARALEILEKESERLVHQG